MNFFDDEKKNEFIESLSYEHKMDELRKQIILKKDERNNNRIDELRKQIMAEEDERIFQAIDDAAFKCFRHDHSGYGGLREECPECQIIYVMES